MPIINLKNLGLGIILLPLGFLFLFAFGEVFSGDISGLGHLVQTVPIILLAVLAWKKPFLGGILLASTSLILGTLYALNVHFPTTTIILVELFLFLPPLISGILLILSSKTHASAKD